jgi:uncharacterized protein
MNINVISTLITIIGEILGTVTGLGNATFFVPIMSFFTNFDHVLGIVAFIHVFSNITRISFFWRNISKEVFVKFGISNILFVGIGALFTRFMNVSIIEVSLGLTLVIFSCCELLFKRSVFTVTPKLETVLGAVAGFFGGLVGTSGPFRSFLLINIGLTKEAYIATSVAVDFIGDALRLLIYILNGFVNMEVIKLLPYIFFASLFGAYIGQKLLVLISPKIFNTLVFCFLLILGISMIVKFI